MIKVMPFLTSQWDMSETSDTRLPKNRYSYQKTQRVKNFSALFLE